MNEAHTEGKRLAGGSKRKPLKCCYWLVIGLVVIFIFSLSSRVLYCGNKIIIITGNYDQRKLEPKLRGNFHMKQKPACRFCSSAVGTQAY